MNSPNKGRTGGRSKDSRRGGKTSPSKSRLKSVSQVSHLNGLSKIHFYDVLSNRKRLHPEAVAADLEDEKILESMMGGDIKVLRETMPGVIVDLETDLKDAALTEAYFLGLGDRPDLVASFWFGNAGAGKVSLVDGHPGHAVRLPGPEWERLVMLADDERHEWEDDSGKVRKSPALHEARKKARAAGQDPDTAMPMEMSGQLHKIYGRLPPWVGSAVGKDLDAADLQGLADEISRKFAEETGKRVLAISFHRETGYDLHVHIIYTEIVEAVRETKAPGKDYVKKLLTDQRKVVRARLADAGVPKPTRLQIQAKLEAMWASGELENPSKPKTQRYYFREDRPSGARKSLVAMGPSYVSKTNLWEASGRAPEVAAVNEQYGHHFTFKARVIEAAKREIGPHCSEGPESVYIDCWLSKTWTKAVMERLSDEARGRACEEAKACVARYVATGSSLPAPFTTKEQKIREKQKAELDARSAEVLAAEKQAEVILAAAKKAEAALPAKELRIYRTAFERMFGTSPKSKTQAGLLSELDTAADAFRDGLVAAAEKDLEPIRQDLAVREEKIGELERKASFWDRVAPMLDRVFATVTGDLKESLEKAVASDPGKPDAEIRGWVAMLARISTVVKMSKIKGKKVGKKADPPIR